ncbi:hypothetical protein MtrunA17_Chr2g0317391 [Medicago truncatula]|uniref:Uncharacterized protein n=1 Tax=Medicago truncatula TaxID=3880 RepID=A0A396JCS0_MEDTR|nr:hypothetical protein MtrunA17_Chr2g0317391 [Medicago truncatula]
MLQIIIQTMEFTPKYLNSLKTIHSLKTFPHPNTLLEFAQHFGLWLDSLNKLLLYNYLSFKECNI